MPRKVCDTKTKSSQWRLSQAMPPLKTDVPMICKECMNLPKPRIEVGSFKMLVAELGAAFDEEQKNWFGTITVHIFRRK